LNTSTKSRTRGRKLHWTEAKARVGGARKTRADLEQELKACRREIANARERLAEAAMQQTATSEMLRIISNSPIQSVLDAVAENAARLCGANNAEIFRLEDNLLRLAASYGEIPVVIHAYQGVPVNRDTVTGRAACDGRTIHVHDLAAEEGEYPVGSSNAKREGHRTTLATPLLREGTPIGIILVRRREIRPFSDEQTALIETFADQAVIAIENARLFEAEKQRTLALAHANRDLAEREAKIRRFVEANIIGIFVWDLEGRIIEANEAFLRMVGYDREDIVSGRMRWPNLTPAELHASDERTLAELKATGTVQPCEREYLRKDGGRVPVLMGSTLFEESGNEGLAFVLDLTERKRAEEALWESEAKIRRLVDSNIIGIFVWDFEGRILEANEEFLRIVNYDREDLVSGRIRWTDLTPPDWRERDNAKIEQHKISGRLEPFEKEYTRKDGSRVPVLIGVATFEEGGNQGVAFVLDLTERKRAEQSLMRSEAYLAETQKLTQTGSWAWDARSQKVLYCSEEMFRIYGLDPQQDLPTRKNFRQRVHPEDRNRVDERFARVVNEKVDSFDEYRVVLPDGTVKHVNSSGHPVLDGNGQLIEFVGTATDVTQRKRAEEALRESEYKLRQITETVPGLVWSNGPDGEPTHVNQRMLDYSGMPFEEFKHLGWEAFVHPADFPETAEAFYHAIQTGTSYQGAMRLRRADGEFRWHHARCEPLCDREGRIVQWYGLSIDIDERKRAEEALRESEAKFSDYAATASDWLWEIGPDYRFTLLTENAFRSDPAARIGTLCWDHVLDLETESERWRLLWATLDSRKPFQNFVYCAADGTGSPMYVKASGKPVFGGNGEFRGYRGTGTDVTAIIRAEYLTQQMFETSSDSLSIVGRDYRYQRANPAFERRWGMPAGTIAGMNVADLLGMESFEKMAKAYLDRCFAGEEVSYIDWLTTPLGRRYSAVTYSPLRPESKRVEAALVIIRDLTEHMLASEGLREAQMELAHANRVATMGQLTASIAHEVNQPIGSARNNARAALNFLERKPPDLDEVREALGCIVADADRAGGIIDRIRDQIKKVPPRSERFDLNRAIEEVIGLAQSMITENGVSVQSRLASGMAPVHGDRVQLQQVVFNLILNAVEAMGSVEADERELLISTDQSEANGTLVAVHDSGPGIDPKHLELVFEAFYSTKSGMGMGLSICRSIIAAHGGRLWAAAIEPGGALFQFMLPSAEAKSSIARPFTTLESRENTFL
jgi:PAS domain S-box-containing protein